MEIAEKREAAFVQAVGGLERLCGVVAARPRPGGEQDGGDVAAARVAALGRCVRAVANWRCFRARTPSARWARPFLGSVRTSRSASVNACGISPLDKDATKARSSRTGLRGSARSASREKHSRRAGVALRAGDQGRQVITDCVAPI